MEESGGRGEYRRLTQGHPYNRCNKELVWENRGRETGQGTREAHHRSSPGGDSVSNCEILCGACHQATF